MAKHCSGKLSIQPTLAVPGSNKVKAYDAGMCNTLHDSNVCVKWKPLSKCKHVQITKLIPVGYGTSCRYMLTGDVPCTSGSVASITNLLNGMQPHIARNFWENNDNVKHGKS